MKNIGNTDKKIRIMAGLLLLLIGIVTGSWLGAIGIIPLATALIGNCPAYQLLGINTCEKQD